MRYLECEGSHLEVGRQQGEAMRDLIRQRWHQDVQPRLARLIEQYPQFDGAAKAISQECRDYIASVAPEIASEIQGLSEGAALHLEQTWLLSTYNSLSFSIGDPLFTVKRVPGENGCSAVALASSSAGPLVMKTNDAVGSNELNNPDLRAKKAEMENRCVYVLKARYASGVTILGVRYSGSIWTECGVNNHGLAFATASLHPRLYPQSARALPQHFFGTLAVLRCGTTDEVRTLLSGIPAFGKGYAMAFGDASGNCVGLEKSGSFTGFNPPRHGLAFQTNHLRSTEMAPRGRQQDPDFWTGSYHCNSSNRARRIQLLPEWETVTPFETIVDELFHAGSEGDLIQDCSEKNQYWITTWSALLFPRTKALWLAEGLPEQRRFQKWQI